MQRKLDLQQEKFLVEKNGTENDQLGSTNGGTTSEKKAHPSHSNGRLVTYWVADF